MTRLHRLAALAAASGIVASGIGYSIWYVALRGLSSTRAATVQLSVPVIAAIGLSPFAVAQSSSQTTSAAAPSLIELALPAVTVPPSRLNAGFNLASDSTVLSPRGPSSTAKRIGSPYRCGTSTAKLPAKLPLR